MQKKLLVFVLCLEIRGLGGQGGDGTAGVLAFRCQSICLQVLNRLVIKQIIESIVCLMVCKSNEQKMTYFSPFDELRLTRLYVILLRAPGFDSTRLKSPTITKGQSPRLFSRKMIDCTQVYGRLLF